MPTYHDQHGGQIKIFCEAPSHRRHIQQLAQLTHISRRPQYSFLESLRK